MPEDPTQGKCLLKVLVHVLGRKPTVFKCLVKSGIPPDTFTWGFDGFDHVGWLPSC